MSHWVEWSGCLHCCVVITVWSASLHCTGGLYYAGVLLLTDYLSWGSRLDAQRLVLSPAQTGTAVSALDAQNRKCVLYRI